MCNVYLGVSKNNGTPKSSILIGFSIINHPFWDTFIFGNTHLFFFLNFDVDLGISAVTSYGSIGDHVQQYGDAFS